MFGSLSLGPLSFARHEVAFLAWLNYLFIVIWIIPETEKGWLSDERILMIRIG